MVNAPLASCTTLHKPVTSSAGTSSRRAWLAAVAAGVFPDIHAAADVMGKLKDEVVTPNPANKAAYDALFADYKTLYDTFGRGANDVMKRLKTTRRQIRGEG